MGYLRTKHEVVSMWGTSLGLYYINGAKYNAAEVRVIVA